MSHVLHSFQVCVFFLCFSSFIYSMKDDIADNSKDECSTGFVHQQEVEQESQLCKLPLDVLYHIASYLYKLSPIRHEGNLISYTYWKEINNLASTCKCLDHTVTAPGKRIRINFGKQRKEDQPCRDFLYCVYNFLERIVRRKGNNSIYLYLVANELAEDMPAFGSFIKGCATSSVVDQLTSLDLGLNGFTELPEDLTKLRALKHLGVDENRLYPDTIEQICTMTFLESLGLDGCDLDGLPDSFENLKLLRVLRVQRNLLTTKDLNLLQKLSNLEELHIGPASVTLADVLKTAANLPKIKLVNPERNMERGNVDLEELFAVLPKTVRVYG